MVCISHSLHKNEDCQLSQFWWDTLGPLTRGLQRCQQCCWRVVPLARPLPWPLLPGQRGGISLHGVSSSAPSKHLMLPSRGALPIAPWQAPSHGPKNIFLPITKPNEQPGPNKRSNNSVPLHTQPAPRRERIYSEQIWGFSLELRFSASNHYF